PIVDQANEVCKQASKSYKALRNLEKKMTRVKPGKMYSNFNRILHQLIGIRNASLLLFIQACGLDPSFEKPDVWNSFEQRWSLLDKQSNEASTRLEEELNNIDNSLREH
ncbi:hypothetical protein MYX76_18650, partial [Desulfobacterota bacterium AH_259_B03_O07]|nr:hypothetical protein [Desulfobacterota bacterium AH_259_B03_O07]